MSVQSWEHFFKPEVRNSGLAFVKKGSVSVSQLSDTEIQSYIRASTSFKVVFKSSSIESPIVTADCTCPLFKKGQFCKHIWAALLIIEEKKPDFLFSKTDLEKRTEANFEPSEKSQSQKTNDSQTAFKAKQNDYRKEQYQKQKQRVKDQKTKAKNKNQNPTDLFPLPIEEALKYFADNGFSLRDNLTKETVSYAMKKLARVFHPDVGGSHEEILELNRYADLLTKFL
ncbi:MAG: SWIM zinc finger family protein [Pseudobdellovibrio sp.]